MSLLSTQQNFWPGLYFTLNFTSPTSDSDNQGVNQAVKASSRIQLQDNTPTLKRVVHKSNYKRNFMIQDNVQKATHNQQYTPRTFRQLTTWISQDVVLSPNVADLKVVLLQNKFHHMRRELVFLRTMSNTKGLSSVYTTSGWLGETVLKMFQCKNKSKCFLLNGRIGFLMDIKRF